ncbi:helicase [Propionivibrio dicarboxylicus]|uniref:Superfamily II DNA or RNA helicase n=1 Tax=Propionivibrio dicarboxylicus TaxID=83767 RepID=A0A1G8AS22_9RHOO|nr:helicase [Propionivibrio dicarboxylicus]SDH23664.1 Superfamily II DNA or RNA helicase [Propionivibrio dicarboxylicus]
MSAYDEFLAAKVRRDPLTGLAQLPDLPDQLFPFQRDIVRWALRRGRAAVFANTGTGKSFMELAWGRAIHQATQGNILLITPLAVAGQMVLEAGKFGITAKHCASQADVEPGITVTNYAKLHHFDLSKFIGVILDESSILKAFDGKTRAMLIERCAEIPYRLAATATPAPNDFLELGNHAEFLGVMSLTGMQATFFTHDGGDTSKWRLKGHAETDFWRWMCSWSVLLRRPSDLGYEDAAFNLPPLDQVEHIVPADGPAAKTLSERIAARRDTITERVAKAVELTPDDRPFVWWCNLNAESEALAAAIPGAVEVRGSDKEEEKERKLRAFSAGEIRILITKPTICGFGMNWQHCADTGFVGLNDSFEQVYQAMRRFWRFGQSRPVTVHFVAASTEGAVLENLRRKEADAERMGAMMVAHMADLSSEIIHGAARDTDGYAPTVPMQIPNWLCEEAA